MGCKGRNKQRGSLTELAKPDVKMRSLLLPCSPGNAPTSLAFPPTPPKLPFASLYPTRPQLQTHSSLRPLLHSCFTGEPL